MSSNKYRPHVYLLPEDDEIRQIAVGFLGHDAVRYRQVDLMPEVGGWRRVLDELEAVYVPLLSADPLAHLVLLIDFDDQVEARRKLFAEAVPAAVAQRVLLLGGRDEAGPMRQALGLKTGPLGNAIAEGCRLNDTGLWDHPQLDHNLPALQGMSTSFREALLVPA